VSKRAVLATLAAFIAGVIFGTGLVLGGMTMPMKVTAFLDVTGDWDPSLICVMIGAIAVYASLSRWITRRRKPLLDDVLHVPTKVEVDRRLAIGATLFGVGWGLAGLCPGPAVTALATGASKAFVFFVAMLIGMALTRAWSAVSISRPQP
jgi:uncharacterized membrane protein YedE/YeeE